MLTDAVLNWVSSRLVFPRLKREGPARFPLLRELEATQWLDAGTLHARQVARLRAIVSHAAHTVPFYRALQPLADARLDDDAFETEFRRLPVLEKADVRDHTDALRSSVIPPSQVRHSKTGGSTGTSLTVFFDVDCEAHRVAAAWRSDGWAGWRPGLLRAALWGNPPVPSTLRERLREALVARMLYLDTVSLTPASMRAFHEEYQRRRPPVLFGHAHSIFMLASFLEQQGLVPVPPRGIISTSMMLLRPEREVIERVYRAKVFDRYGCEEVGLIAAECDRHEGLHVDVDHVYVELLDEQGRPVAPGEPGQIVVTDLMNRAMPLIRYRVGDVAVASERACTCGRGQPLLRGLVGRTADFLIRPDGTLVAGVSLIERTLTHYPAVREMQVVQNELHALEVRIVPDPGYDAATREALAREFTTVFGPEVRVTLEERAALEKTGAGKYRFSICNVPHSLRPTPPAAAVAPE